MDKDLRLFRRVIFTWWVYQAWNKQSAYQEAVDRILDGSLSKVFPWVLMPYNSCENQATSNNRKQIDIVACLQAQRWGERDKYVPETH